MVDAIVNSMIAIFLANDRRTLVSKHVDHVHITEEYNEEELAVYYHSTFFFLNDGMLTLATSAFAEKHIGELIGVLADGEDPEVLREKADRAIFEAMNIKGRMQ